MPTRAGEKSGCRAGFTLVELVAVLAVAALLGFLLMAALSPLLTSGNLTQAGDAVRDEIKLAAQQAQADNGETDVMFYRLPDASGNLVWRGIQVIELVQQADGSSSPVPLGRMVRLPDGIMLAASMQLSPLLTADTQLEGTGSAGGAANVPCAGFRFRARGEPEPAVTSANNFLTLQPETDTSVPPKNFYTVSVDPATGGVAVYRP